MMEESAPLPIPEQLVAGSTSSVEPSGSSTGGEGGPPPLHSSSGSSFVILDEDNDDELEVSIPLQVAPSGSGMEAMSMAAPVVAIDVPPQPQPEIKQEEADEFFSGDDFFVSAVAPVEVAVVEPFPAPSNVSSMAEGVEDQEEFGEFAAPPNIPVVSPTSPPPADPQVPAASTASVEAEEEKEEFGEFETLPPAPAPAPAQVAPAAPAEEAAPSQAQAEAPVIPQIGEEAVEHDEFGDDFGDDVEFVSAAAPPPAPTAAPMPSQAPQDAAEATPAAATMTVVPSVPAVAGTGTDDAEDAARAFFEAAYGQGVRSPSTKEETAEPEPWIVGGRRRLLAELDANLDSRCRLLNKGGLEPRASHWAAAILNQELLATLRGGGSNGDVHNWPHDDGDDDDDDDIGGQENAINITWALASSPAPPRSDPGSPPLPPPPPKAAAPAPAPVSTPAPAPPATEENNSSDLDLDFLAGLPASGSGGVGTSQNSSSSGGGGGGVDGPVSALIQTLGGMGLKDDKPAILPKAATTGSIATALFSLPPSFASFPVGFASLAPPAPQAKTGPLSAEAEAVIAEVPDLGYVLSKTPFLPHHRLPTPPALAVFGEEEEEHSGSGEEGGLRLF